jgi:hypothetical protein
VWCGEVPRSYMHTQTVVHWTTLKTFAITVNLLIDIVIYKINYV